MSKIIIYIAQSLNGKIARNDGSIDWLGQFDGEEYGYLEFLDKVKIVLMGNKTYQQVLTFGEFPYKNKDVYVFTMNSALQKDEHVTFISGNITEFVSSLKKSDKGDIWLVGGTEINTIFIEAKLVDELQLFTMPLFIQSGIDLVHTLSMDCKLKLINSKIYKNGIVEGYYQLIY